MPLLVQWLALNNAEDRISTTSAEKQCCQNVQFTDSCLDMLPCSLHSNHLQTSSVFSFKSCLWPTLTPSVTYPNTVKVSAPVFANTEGFEGECVCFIFRWRCAWSGGQESLPLSSDTVCVLQGMSHHSQASALSLSCLSVLVVVACGPANSSAFARVVQHGGEFSHRSTVLFQVTLLK